MLLVIDPIPDLATRVSQAQETVPLYRVEDLGGAETYLAEHDHEVTGILLGSTLDRQVALDVARKLNEQHPAIQIVLCSLDDSPQGYRQAMRSGVSDVLPWDADVDEIREVVHRAVHTTERLHASEAGADEVVPLGTTIALFATKGGVGKSFLATNLAVQLAQTYPGEVVLFDLDLQAGDAAIMLQLTPVRGMLEVSEMGEVLDEQALAGFLTTAVDGTLKVLPAPASPVHAEGITPEDVTRTLRLLRQMFRFVVIDCPPFFTEQVLVALEQTDTVVVVSSLEVPAIKNLKVAVQTLRELGIGRERLRLALNRADSKVGLTVREVEKSLGTTVDVTIPSSREVPFAINQGVPIVTSRPKAIVSKALVEAADKIVGRATMRGDLEEEPTGRRRRRRG